MLLLSNEIRDCETDRDKDIQTLTVRIGYQNAVSLYWFLIALSYVLVIVFLFFGEYLQQGLDLLWLLLPLPLLIPIRGYLNADDRTQLTPMTGRFFFLFGIAYMLVLSPPIHYLLP